MTDCGPYPVFLKAAIAGADPFNKNDRDFSAEGHALFEKLPIDTEVAQTSVDYYKQPIEYFPYRRFHFLLYN